MNRAIRGPLMTRKLRKRTQFACVLYKNITILFRSIRVNSIIDTFTFWRARVAGEGGVT